MKTTLSSSIKPMGFSDLWRILPLLAISAICLLPSSRASGQGVEASKVGSGKLEVASIEEMRPYARYLNEFSDRRRSTVHFQNQQSVLRGVRIGFVNVGHGNLTLARRDLVVVGLLPIVAARVYDSSSADSGDFGAGWHLSIAETIVPQVDGSMLLLDETGAATQFVRSNGEFITTIPHPTNILSFSQVNDQTIVLRLHSGIIKRYRLTQGLFRLVRIEDRNDNTIQLHYEQGRLRRIAGTRGRFVDIERDADGRIVAVTDDQRRSAGYSYDAKGHLEKALDLGGSAWTYEYDAVGRLIVGFDPLGEVDFSANYDEQGRVTEMINRRQAFRLQYAEGVTKVIDHQDRVTEFTQNTGGITVAVRNPSGVTTGLAMDELNRAVELTRNKEGVAWFSYDDAGRLASMTRTSDFGLQTIIYRYNAAGRLVGATDDLGHLDVSIRYDGRGNVRSVQRGEEWTVYGYARNGALRALRRSTGENFSFDGNSDGQVARVTDAAGQSTELFYSMTGRLSQIRFADGSTHNYGYEPSGLRSFTQPSDAKLLRNHYSASGNLYLLEHVGSNGNMRSDEYVLDNTNRLERVLYAEGALDIAYNASGDPELTQTPAGGVRYAYDAQDRLVSVTDQGRTLIYAYNEDEPDLRLQVDRETGVSLLPIAQGGATIGAAFEILYNRTRPTPYQVVHFDAHMRAFQPVSDIGIILLSQSLEDSLARLRLLDLGEADMDTKSYFAKPSNVLFIPSEFWSVNCYTPPFPRCQRVAPPVNSAGLGSSSFEPDLEPTPEDCGGGTLSCLFDLNVQSTDSFLISAMPKMPSITLTATSVVPSNASISWSAKLAHTLPSGCTGGPTFASTVTGTGQTFSPAWNGFYGGPLTVKATCSAPNYASRSETDTTKEVKGIQPADSVIATYIGAVAAPFDSADLRRIGCWESSLTQFSNGLPLLGPGGDLGIMQICFQRTSNDVWNWKVNVDKGRSILNTAKNSARNYLDGQVAGGATAYSTNMWRQEGIHRYNAGTQSDDMYWEWNGALVRWVVVDRGGAGGYVTNVTGKSATCT